MGGEQAANVLATVRREDIEARGGTWPKEEEEAFKAPIRGNTKSRPNPYYATARRGTTGSSTRPTRGAYPALTFGRPERADRTDALRLFRM